MGSGFDNFYDEDNKTEVTLSFPDSQMYLIRKCMNIIGTDSLKHFVFKAVCYYVKKVREIENCKFGD